MTQKTHEVRLVSYPVGLPSLENFRICETVIPQLKTGQILVKNLFMSVDPYMRGRMRNVKSYVPPFQLDKAMEGGAVGIVQESKDPAYTEGDSVIHQKGWREYSVTNAPELRKIDTQLAPPSTYLGIMGMTGFTAWVGLHEIAKMKASEIVFISAAAGAVGSVAGQLAKIKGCKVIGSVGSDEKVKLLKNEFGFDSAFNYKSGEVNDLLKESAPDGIDLYFDNVGGDQLQAALNSLRPHGRIAACGAISVYNEANPTPGPNNLALMIGKRLMMRGFIVSDHSDLFPKISSELAALLKSKQLIVNETIHDGIGRAPETFLDMMIGKNVGKMLVKLN